MPRWRNGPSDVPAAPESLLKVLKIPPQGTENIVHLCLPHLFVLPVVHPEGERCFPALWRRLWLAPSSKSTWMSQEHPTPTFQVSLCQRPTSHLPLSRAAFLLSWTGSQFCRDSRESACPGSPAELSVSGQQEPGEKHSWEQASQRQQRAAGFRDALKAAGHTEVRQFCSSEMSSLQTTHTKPIPVVVA